MAQITNKRLGELIQALFRILEKYPDGMKAGDALAALAATVTLTEYEAGSYESGRRFEKNCALCHSRYGARGLAHQE